jgi:hypothetical protein
MSYASVRIKEIVRRSVDHDWSIPEFQRGFVWKATQVRDLIESLWRGFPVGTLLVWNSSRGMEARGPSDGKALSLWVVDGQQRTTALCILSGRKPYWWKSREAWDELLRKYDVRFDIHAKEEPYFVIANAATRKVRSHRYIRVAELLNLDTKREEDQNRLQELAKQVKFDGLCDGMDAMEVYTRLDRVRKVRDAEVVAVTVDNDLEDVVEIFARLNSRGTRVKEADIYLGVVAARSPGWVRKEFLPYVDQLADAGYQIDPNLLFRTLTGIGVKRVRYNYVEDSFWQADQIHDAWARTKRAWSLMIARFKDFGIAGNALMPTGNALVTTIALVDKFPDDDFRPILFWFLQASRFGRYSGSSTTSMEEDLRDVDEACTQHDALERLLRRIRYVPPLSAEDFLRDYGDSRFGRLMLYLLIYRNEALDWDKRGLRIGFDEQDVMAGFQPQFHHIFPKKLLEGQIDPPLIDALANIAVIGPTINIRINKKDPLDYIPRYEIGAEKLRQQLIEPAILSVTLDGYPEWLRTRAEALAAAANRYLEELRSGVNLPPVVAEEQTEHAYHAA